MPKSCWECEVGSASQLDNKTCPFYAMEGQEQENYQNKIAEGCPLIPVPQHGRCIDADALKVSLVFAEKTAKWAVPALRAVLMVIDEMPTIIEADGEK